jgi:hypothetical protein
MIFVSKDNSNYKVFEIPNINNNALWLLLQRVIILYVNEFIILILPEVKMQ